VGLPDGADPASCRTSTPAPDEERNDMPKDSPVGGIDPVAAVPQGAAIQPMKMRALARLQEVLSAAAARRSSNWVTVDGPCGREPDWLAYERQQLLAEVNWWRAGFGLGPVDEHVIARGESSACGHSDYALKYTLFCAEVAIGYPPHWLRLG
jgi:hypothetical protein